MKQIITYGVDADIIDLSPERIEMLHEKAKRWNELVKKYNIKVNQ